MKKMKKYNGNISDYILIEFWSEKNKRFLGHSA